MKLGDDDLKHIFWNCLGGWNTMEMMKLSIKLWWTWTC